MNKSIIFIIRATLAHRALNIEFANGFSENDNSSLKNSRSKRIAKRALEKKQHVPLISVQLQTPQTKKLL